MANAKKVGADFFTNEVVKNEVVALFNEIRSGGFDGYLREETADAYADFYVEWQFARCDLEVSLKRGESHKLFERAKVEFERLMAG
jgi:hypothetical protein